MTQEARKKAVDDARKKASELSSAAGMTLGKIVNIQEGTSNRIYPMMAKSADTEIQPGTTDITSSVTLFYETR